MTSPKVSTFHTIDHCGSDNLSAATIIADLDGTLLRSRSSFPYFALVAFETGGPLRLLVLLLMSPLIALLHNFISESAGIQVLIFVTLAGTKISTIKSVARAVLPKFYAADVHPETWRVFSAGHRRCVVTANPTVMVEPFLKECLGVEVVVGTKLATCRGRATGFVRSPGVVVGGKKAEEVKRVFGDGEAPDIGIGGRRSDFAFMRLCKEGYLVPPTTPKPQPVLPKNLPKPIIFHDGRLVQKPTPLLALLTVLWIPAAFLLACLRVATTFLVPIRFTSFSLSALGVRFIVNGTPPPPSSSSSSSILFICCHRTLLDPVFLSAVLRRPVSTVTYSLSRLSEFLSPIKTVRLTRNRAADAAIIRRLLAGGDVVICPEGTTCRESFLLRFSALFAELADDIVPVAVVNKMSMFHGTTVRGWKAMDPFYFFMNPSPVYEFTFLDKVPRELTCAGGKESHEVANYVQKVIAASLGYTCTSLTRKDKYMALAENDGTVVENGHVGKK